MRVNIRRIVAIGMMLVVLMSQAACQNNSSKKSKGTIPGSSITPAPKVETNLTGDGENPTLTGVLTYLNTTTYKMHFVDISTGTEYEVPYTGGTDIQDAYKNLKAAANMEIGELYDVYVTASGKAAKIYGNSEAWERNDISGITVNEEGRKIGIGGSNLIYESYCVIISGINRLSIAQIVDQDKLTIRGVGDKIYSIVVKSGHGYIQFTGVDQFIGGYVGIGDKLLYGVTSDMLVTAPEGTQVIDIKKGSLASSKTVTVKKDETVTIDFSEIQPAPTKNGTINFSVTPSNAIMSIDGEEVDHSSPISLSYGTHRVKLVCNHYEEYSEIITVNSPYVTKVIDMTASSNSGTTASDLTKGYTVSVKAPEGAALYVNSEYIGLIPCTFDKTYGNKTITLKKDGYNTVSYTISINNSSGDLTYSFPDMVKTTDGSSTTNATTSETTPTVATPSVATPTVTVP